VGGLGVLDHGEGAEVVAGQLQGVEEGAGAAVLDVSGGHVGEDEGDGDLDGLGVLEGREAHAGGGAGEGFGDLGEGFAVAEHLLDVFRGQEAEGRGRRKALGVGVVEGAVEVAIGGAMDGGGLAAVAVGLDVAADGVFGGGGGGHGSPRRIKWEGPQADACGPSLLFYLYYLIIWDCT
jgi:hypothetical protein